MAQDKKCTKCGREQSRSLATKHGWFGVTFHLYACHTTYVLSSIIEKLIARIE